MSYGEFTLNGGKCGQCIGYSIYYQDQCVASCPPSSYYNGETCVTCSTGQVWDGSQCVTQTPTTPTNPTNPTTPTTPTTTITCPIGTYWDGQQLRCLACPSGCASCPDCYSCATCSPGFFLGSDSPLCQEICGDGMKFVSECDDGNTRNGDGCSSTCEVETDYVCKGGSAYAKDTCQHGLPTAITFKSSGQSHVWGKVIINVKLNYLPQDLIDSAVDCKNQCNNVLSASIISGDKSAVSILAQYIPNTRYSFSVEVDFGKEPIGMFVVQVGLRDTVAAKYFSGMDTSSTLNVNVNPAYFTTHQTADTLV